MKVFISCLIGCLAIFIVAGCGSNASGTFNSVAQKAKTAQDRKADQAPGKQDGQLALDENRKIIYNGTLDVQVKNLVDARKQLEEAMKAANALFSKTEIMGDSGRKRVGHFSIRVPVTHFQSLHAAIAAIGNPIKDQTDSQDVTDEFIDLTARVKNFKNEEIVLNKLLTDAGHRLEDVFKIREQISKNRLEVERIEGKLQSLEKLTSFSTLTVTLREIEEYHAPTAPVTEDVLPNFSSEASGMWKSSLSKLIYLFQMIGLGVIAITPWLPLILGLAIPLWFVTKPYRVKSDRIEPLTTSSLSDRVS